MPGRHEFSNGLVHAIAVNLQPDTRTRHAQPAAVNGAELVEHRGRLLRVHGTTLRLKVCRSNPRFPEVAVRDFLIDHIVAKATAWRERLLLAAQTASCRSGFS
jgi:hypothetical protein